MKVVENKTASKILDLMAAELAGMLDGMPRRNPMVPVIEQRIEAINTAKDALADDHKDRPRGRWLISCDGYYPYCSECKEEPKGGVMTNYCPTCGAIMGGADSHE